MFLLNYSYDYSMILLVFQLVQNTSRKRNKGQILPSYGKEITLLNLVKKKKSKYTLLIKIKQSDW